MRLTYLLEGSVISHLSAKDMADLPNQFAYGLARALSDKFGPDIIFQCFPGGHIEITGDSSVSIRVSADSVKVGGREFHHVTRYHRDVDSKKHETKIDIADSEFVDRVAEEAHRLLGE